MTVETMVSTAPETVRTRRAPRRRYLMCRPDHFDVTYAINPWMDPTITVDRERAIRQWETLVDTYRELGHVVDLVDPAAGLPDMVFAANGGIVSDGRAMAATFTHAERRDEGELYLRWFHDAGLLPAVQASEQNEGEGDVLRVGEIFLAGTGFRTSVAAHREVEEFFGRRVVGLRLVDPRFYHLDTALTVLDDSTIAYYPGAFDGPSLALLAELFPDAILASQQDAEVFGLNAMSDGLNVVLSDRATGLHQQYRDRGFNPVAVDMSELLKAGGSAKCCTLEIRA